MWSRTKKADKAAELAKDKDLDKQPVKESKADESTETTPAAEAVDSATVAAIQEASPADAAASPAPASTLHATATGDGAGGPQPAATASSTAKDVKDEAAAAADKGKKGGWFGFKGKTEAKKEAAVSDADKKDKAVAASPPDADASTTAAADASKVASPAPGDTNKIASSISWKMSKSKDDSSRSKSKDDGSKPKVDAKSKDDAKRGSPATTKTDKDKSQAEAGDSSDDEAAGTADADKGKTEISLSQRLDMNAQLASNLWKRDTAGGSKWDERYVVLKDGFLLYYDKQKTPMAVFNMHPKVRVTMHALRAWLCAWRCPSASHSNCHILVVVGSCSTRWCRRGNSAGWTD